MKKVLFGLMAAGCMVLLGGCGGDDYYEMPEADADYEDYEDYDLDEDGDYEDYDVDSEGYEDYDSDEYVDYEDSEDQSADSEIGEYDQDVNLSSFLGSYRSADETCTVDIKECTNDYHEVDVGLYQGVNEEGYDYYICWKYYPSFDSENFRLYADKGPRFDEWFENGELVRGDQTSSSEAAYFYFSGGKLVWINRVDENAKPIVLERVE